MKMWNKLKSSDVKTYAKIIFSVVVMAFGTWLGAWVLFIGGIVDFFKSFGGPEFQGTIMSFGVLKFISSGIVGWLIIFLGLTLFSKADKRWW